MRKIEKKLSHNHPFTVELKNLRQGCKGHKVIFFGLQNRWLITMEKLNTAVCRSCPCRVRGFQWSSCFWMLPEGLPVAQLEFVSVGECVSYKEAKISPGLSIEQVLIGQVWAFKWFFSCWRPPPPRYIQSLWSPCSVATGTLYKTADRMGLPMKVIRVESVALWPHHGLYK